MMRSSKQAMDIRRVSLPAHSQCAAGFGRIDYSDAYTAFHTPPCTLDEALARVTAFPAWARPLVRLRNVFARACGLKTGKTPQDPAHAQGAGYAFPILARTPHEIIAGEDDKHLCFRLSLLQSDSPSAITLITLVRFHNVGGKAYFALIKPFHCVLMRAILKQLY